MHRVPRVAERPAVPGHHVAGSRRSGAEGVRLALLGIGLAALLPGALGAAEARFEVMLWIDHQDWATPSGGREWDTNTPAGLEQIVEHCQEAGATTLCWRGFGGGLTTYASQVEEGCYPQLFDKRRTSDPLFHNGGVRYGDQRPDILGTVVEICHRRGLRCLLYWPLEDTHNLMAFISRYALEHPQFWDQRQDGYASPARLSLAFREVLDYKLALAREMIARGVDGFFLDFRRQSNWGPDFGYVQPTLAAYEAATAHAPAPSAADWLRLRAAYNTLLVAELRAASTAAGRPLEIIAAPPTISAEPKEQLQANFVDWPTWVEQGLIDGLAPDTLPTWDPARPLASIVEQMNAVRGILNGRAKLYWPIRTGYDWGNGLKTLAQQLNQPVQQTLAEILRLAWENGAAGVHDDTFDPGLETAEWIATLRDQTGGDLRLPQPTPVPAPAVALPPSQDIRPVLLAMAAGPVPPALEDTVAAQKLTLGAANDGEGRFSPDAAWVVFQSDRGGQGMRLWLAPAAGGQPRQLTFSPGGARAVCNDLFPTFTPDGTSVVFSSDRGDGRFYHLYSIPVAGGELRALTGGNATDTLPCCSPDGSRIVFSSTREADLYTRSDTLWEIPAAGGEPRSLGALKYTQTQPSFSADGRVLAFTALDELERTNWYACVSSGDPAVRSRLTSPQESCYGAAVNPSGTAVAYTSPGPDRERGWDIWIRAIYSDTLVRVTNAAGNDRSPAWSPDGTRLLFESNRDGSYKLYTVDVSGLAFPAPAAAQPWTQTEAANAGMVDGDNDPEHTPLAWGPGVRPALDYMNRSFGRHLGQRTRVSSITIVNDMPGQAGAVSAECRIDADHTELYYGEKNGEFTRYRGPLSFSVRREGGHILITLGDLDLETTLVKVRFVYPDKDFTAVCSNVEGAVMVNADQGQGGQPALRLWTTLQGQNRLLAWTPSSGVWRAAGHELSAVAMPDSDSYSGEGARIVLPQRLEGDFEFACQFLLPDNSTGAGGPVLYFGLQDDGTLYAVRYVNYWGTTTLQKKMPGQSWVQLGYSMGHDVSIGQWHELSVSGRGGEFRVTMDGIAVATGRDPAYRGGAVGLGCQVRPVTYRSLRLAGTAATALPDWRPAAETTPYVVVCADAGRGGYQAFPGLCILDNGDLLAVYYAGWGHVSRPDATRPTGGAVGLSRSVDSGRTWAFEGIVLDSPLDDRDPAVWQCDDGTVYISTVAADWGKYTPPYEQWCYAYTVRSTDRGHTWTAPLELRLSEKRDLTVWTEPRRLASGAWLWPVYLNCGFTSVGFLRSSDGGHTWGPLTLIDPASRSTDEPDVCQFADGSLLCAMRPGPEPHMWQSRSRDDGQTWDKPTPLPFYGHCANLLVTTSGVTLLAHRDPGMSIHYSLDQGQTWPGAVMLDTCGGAYGHMLELPDGRVLVVYYTEGGRSQIRAQWLRVGPDGVRQASAE